MATIWDGRERRHPAGYDFVIQQLESLDKKMDGQHARVNSALDKIDGKMDQQGTHLVSVDKRVLTIETERGIEDRQVLRRSTWIALVISLAGLMMTIWMGR